jgi:hypothetical protein
MENSRSPLATVRAIRNAAVVSATIDFVSSLRLFLMKWLYLEIEEVTPEDPNI